MRVTAQLHREERLLIKSGGNRHIHFNSFPARVPTVRVRRSVLPSQCLRNSAPKTAVHSRAPLPASDPQPQESVCQGLLDTWLEVEDLWGRLARLCHSTVLSTTDSAEVIFANVSDNDWECDSVLLIDLVLGGECYRWCEGSSHGGFAQCVEFRGDDLAIAVTSVKEMVRWPGGDDICLMVKQVLQRVQERHGQD